MRYMRYSLFLVFVGLQTAFGTRLHCLPFRKRYKARRRLPTHVQVTRCCGDIPYSSLTHGCCYDGSTAEICYEWSPWKSWSTCSATCGGGERIRNRHCEKGQGCLLDRVAVEKCGSQSCDFSFCRTCTPSESNEECNAQAQICNTLDGEGCQNVVRAENSRIFVEKRCKQLQACHTESRNWIIQGICDPRKHISLCSHCCEGRVCNLALNWTEPVWYRKPWEEWLLRLVDYTQIIQNGREKTPYLTSFERFYKMKSSMLMADIPLQPIELPQFTEETSGNTRLKKTRYDEIIIETILEVSKSNSTTPTKSLIRKLYNRLPKNISLHKTLRYLFRV